MEEHTFFFVSVLVFRTRAPSRLSSLPLLRSPTTPRQTVTTRQLRDHYREKWAGRQANAIQSSFYGREGDGFGEGTPSFLLSNDPVSAGWATKWRSNQLKRCSENLFIFALGMLCSRWNKTWVLELLACSCLARLQKVGCYTTQVRCSTRKNA